MLHKHHLCNLLPPLHAVLVNSGVGRNYFNWILENVCSLICDHKHACLITKFKNLALERIWLKPKTFKYMFYLQQDQFKKPSSKSLLQLPSVGFAWEEGPLWQHCAAEIISPSSCLKALIARLADTVGVPLFFFSQHIFDFTRNEHFLTTVECAWWWRRVSERKAWKRASEKTDASAMKELKCDWVAFVSAWMRACWHFPASPIHSPEQMDD